MNDNSLEIKITGNSKPYKQALADAKKNAEELANKAAKAVEEANKKAREAVEATDKATKRAAESAAKEARKAANNAIAEAQRASKEVQEIENEIAQNRKEAMDGIEKGTGKVLKVAGAVSGAVLGVGVAYNSQIEQYKVGFETMLGSAKKADETLGELENLASTTPFELTDLANASTTLLAFGEETENLIPDLKMLGDISLGNREKFNSLALVFGQVKSQGRLMGQDLLQMINAGFNPLLVISEKTGESMDSLKDKMSKGQITFEMVADAMKTATSQGGQFYNAMEAQSKTLQGQFSTLKDSVQEFAGEVSEDLSEYLTNTVLPALIEKMETLKEMWEDGSLQKWLGGAAAAATMLGIALAAIKVYKLYTDFKKMVSAIKSATIAQKALNAAQNANPWILLASAIIAVVSALYLYSRGNNSAAKSAEELNEQIARERDEHNQNIEAIEKEKAEKLAELEVTMSLKDRLYELEDQLKSGKLSEEEATKARNEFNQTANELNNIIPGIVDNIKDENGELSIQRKEVDALTSSYANLIETKATADAYYQILTDTKAKRIKAEQKAREKRNELTDYIKEQYKTHQENNKNAAGGEVVTPWAYGQEWERNHQNDEVVKTYNTAKAEAESYIEEEEAIKKDYMDAVSEARSAQENYNKFVKQDGDNTANHLNNLVDETTDNLKSNLDQQKNAVSQAAKDELAIIDKAHTLGHISDDEYYYELGKIRDKYFQEGSSEWESYTDKIENYVTSSLKKLKDEMEKLATDMQGKVDEYSKRLQDDTHKTYSTITLYEGDTPKTMTTLANMDYQNDKLQEYLDLLKAVKEKRGDIPESAMDELRNMDTDTAITFLQTMLKQSDEQWAKWASGLEQNQKLADEVAKETYSSEIEENERLITNLQEMWDAYADDFTTVGTISAKNFSEAFMKEMLEAHKIWSTETANMFSGKNFAFLNGGVNSIVGGGSSTTYTDNRTTNIYANGTSARGVIEATKQANIYQQHTSTFGG